MSKYERLSGTTDAQFQISGPNAPCLVDNGAALEIRTSTNNPTTGVVTQGVLTIVRGANPVGSSDLTTKSYVDNASAASKAYVDAHGTLTPPANGSWAQATWFIDPVSGSDTNNGFTSGTPLKTWAALIVLWGTISPRLRQNTTITFLSSHVDDTDPVYFAPYIENRAGVVITGVLGAPQIVLSGTLASVLNITRSTGQLTQADFGGTLAAGLLVNNTTHSSFAWTYTNPLSTVWNCSAPMAPITVGYPTKVAWTTGDSFVVYQPVAVNIVLLSPIEETLDNSSTQSLVIRHLTVLEPTSGVNNQDILSISAGANVNFIEMSFLRNIGMSASGVHGVQVLNCDQGSHVVTGTISLSQFIGGQMRGVSPNWSTFLDGDAIVGASTNAVMNWPGGYGTFFIDTGTISANITGSCGSTSIVPGGNSVIWGPGAVNVQGPGRLQYSGTAVATFLNTGGLKINGLTVACSISVSGITSGISLTAANLDASAGPGGFGGNAFLPTGGSITNGTNVTGFSTSSGVSISGDGTGIESGGVIPLVLSTVNSSPGSYGSSSSIPVVTVDGKGRITAISAVAVGGGSAITSLSGDGTATGPGASVFTLSTVNPDAGTFGDGTDIPVITVDGKGRITAISTTPNTPPLGSATGTLGVTNGGTGATALTAHGVLVGEGTAPFVSVPMGNGQLLIGQTGADPASVSLSGDATIDPTGVLTLASVGTAGTYGAGSIIPTSFTTDVKGRVTSVTARQLTQDDIAPGFAITGFSGGSTVEIGATVTNPAFTASYNQTPTSAQITNTFSIDSPLALISPYTSGTVVGAFTSGSQTSCTFTLTAIGTATKTANQAITWLPRSFGGVGTAGATSATASGSTAVLVGATGTLADEGLSSSNVGATFGPFSPTSQKIYLLLIHTASAHTFKDGNGFTFSFNAPTTFSFTNQQSAAVSMDLYESTNILNSSFSITVTS